MTIYLHPRPHNFLVATGWENVGNGFIRLCSLCTSFIFEVKRGFSLPCRSIFTAAFPSVHCRWSCNIPFQIFHPSHIYSNVTLKPHLVILYGFYVLIWKSHSEIYIAWNPPLFFHGWIWFFFFFWMRMLLKSSLWQLNARNGPVNYPAHACHAHSEKKGKESALSH